MWPLGQILQIRPGAGFICGRESDTVLMFGHATSVWTVMSGSIVAVASDEHLAGCWPIWSKARFDKAKLRICFCGPISHLSTKGPHRSLTSHILKHSWNCYTTPPLLPQRWPLTLKWQLIRFRKRDLTCVVKVPDKADVSLMVRHLVLIPVIKSVNMLMRFIRFSGTVKQATDCSCSRNRKFEIVLRHSSLRTVAPRPHRLSLLILLVSFVWSQSPPEQRVPTDTNWSGLV